MTKIYRYKPEFKNYFRDLNIEWISKFFEVEKHDLEQLDNPEQIIADGGEILFLEHNGTIVGCVALVHQGQDRFELAKMAVKSELRGQGLGDELMNAAIDWFEEKQGTELFLLSNTVLTPAINLYKKYGFVALEESCHPDYKRCNIIMKWDAKNSPFAAIKNKENDELVNQRNV